MVSLISPSTQPSLTGSWTLWWRILCPASPQLVKRHLSSLGYHIQRAKIRESLYRVDPLGVEDRCRRLLHRRKYSVPGPNSLWHIDGNHKLVRWRVVIHGGIDGYSHIPVYLAAASNNRSETVLQLFSHCSRQVWIAL